MRFLLSLLLAMGLSLVLGIGSAWFMLAAPRTGTVRVGGWQALPTIDAAGADPYVRARVARTGEFGMGAGEGLTFVADADAAGNALRGTCLYVLSGLSPKARLWTLTATDGEGHPARTPIGRAHVDGRSLLRDGHGRFEVVLSPTARPGNWLATPAGAFVLTLRLYDTPIILSSDKEPPQLPTIERRACR